MKKKRIGIITFHASLNFGSALQAFALQHMLTKAGHHAKIIDFILPSDMRQYRLFQTYIYPVHPKALVRDFLYLFNNIKRKKQFAAFAKAHFALTEPTLYAQKDDLHRLNEMFDGFICGSDQIWNLNCTGRFVPEYFLDFAADNKIKIAYAPSMPTTVKEMYYPQLRKSIERLDAISVREKQTAVYLQEDVGVEKSIAHVVDPTLLLDAQDYIAHFALSEKKAPYIFVYILGDVDAALIDMANRTSQKTGLPIKYVYTKKLSALRKATFALGMGPEEFLQSIYEAAYVITNSFHATVFAVQFHKPMCVFAPPGSSSRMVELLTTLGLENNLYAPDNAQWMTSHADDRTDEKRRQIASHSLQYLLDALSIEPNS